MAVVITSHVVAQTAPFGEPFPLTNTRYGEASGSPLLLASDRADLLFWRTDEGVRVTRIVDGERRGGRGVLDTSG